MRKRLLRPCTLMMVQNEHWNGQPRPRSKLDRPPWVRLTVSPDSNRRRLALDRGQILHVVVDGFELAGIGIAQDLVEPEFLGLAGKDRSALRLHARDFFGYFRQHGEAARHMKAADRHRQSGIDERLRDIGGARKLVRLNADKGNQCPSATATNIADDPVGTDANVGLIIGRKADIDIRTQYLATHAVERQSVDGGERVGGNIGTKPLNGIAVVVVMRRLDHYEMKCVSPDRTHGTLPLLPIGQLCRLRYPIGS